APETSTPTASAGGGLSGAVRALGAWIPGFGSGNRSSGGQPAPVTDAPKVDAPTSEAPTSEAPTSEAPAADAPKVAAPKVDAPTSDAPAREPAPSVTLDARPESAEPGEPAPPDRADAPATKVAEIPPERRSWMAKLRQGLSKTRSNLSTLFLGARIDEALYEELETALLTSDAGFETTTFLLESLRARVRKDKLTEASQVRDALRQLLTELLMPLEQPIDIDRAEPLVVMISGVNGAGKTTSIGKLTHHLQREGKSILLAAGDTFRAAAREQLAEWGARNDVQVIAQQGGDPAAVAFDAVAAGRARGTGVVIVDTAGRLPTQHHLMDELRKINRVIGKAMPDAPHESLLVLDGNTGQNMLAQVKAFDDAVRLTGLIVTKLDGTAKGGALAALAHTRRDRPLPVYFIGVGEGLDDLQAFSAAEFASALVD
ncbi:MAG: Cell division protein FtsY, partial [Pseudomonadota bacterium]